MTVRPRVVNRRNRPRDCRPVYVGRPSRWGNPFEIGSVHNGLAQTREGVIELYRSWLLSQPELVARAKSELRGKDLECWCAPLPCHADVLLEIANNDQENSDE